MNNDFFQDANEIMKLLCQHMLGIFFKVRKLYTEKENKFYIAPTV